MTAGEILFNAGIAGGGAYLIDRALTLVRLRASQAERREAERLIKPIIAAANRTFAQSPNYWDGVDAKYALLREALETLPMEALDLLDRRSYLVRVREYAPGRLGDLKTWRAEQRRRPIARAAAFLGRAIRG